MKHFTLLDPDATEAPDWEVLLQAADSYNGYERLRAVRWLEEAQTGEELKPLLKRANDWVPQVRHAAQSALIARLTPEYAYRLACVLPEIENLQRLGRDSHAGFIGRVHALLISLEGESGLLHACHHGPSPAREHCRLLALRRLPGTHGAHWLEESLNDADWLRRLAARHARTEATEAQLVRWTREQSIRPPASIAQELLYGLVERFPEAAPPVLDTLLLSRYTALRQTAQFYSKAHRNISDYYQAYFPEPLALLGWTESGGDLEILEPFLTDANPKLRRAALHAVAQRDPERFKPQLLAALADSTIGASRPVVAALRRVLLSSDEPILQTARFGAAPYQRRRLIGLLTALPHWSIPAALLEFTPLEDEAVHELERWLNQQVFTRPTTAQFTRLQTCLPQCPEAQRAKLGQALAYVERFVL
ncbi:hypothetical protein [Armatimonas sp.]|uniref:hypothetical protein n=1 Tax=Armatimonas sp. TaxID=1872638 RepID=UPI00286AA303|nr:hypothetical protein [Armatimonas sp.]